MIEPRDQKAKQKPPRPALASRILAVGASAAATIGLVGAMVARTPAQTAGSARSVVASASARPLRIVVVIKRPRSAALSVSRAPSATRAPRIIRRYVTVPAATTSHAS